MSGSRAANAAGVSKSTAYFWFERCRQMCSTTQTPLPKMEGTADEPIQVDDSYFAGHRKYNRRIMAKGDKAATNEREPREGLDVG